MHVIVLGAGIVGVTTAYFLRQQGFEVTVVDRAAAAASGASHANGGQLSYSFTDSLAKPAFISSIAGILAGRDAGAQLRLSPQLFKWGAQFLSQCTASRSRQNTLTLLAVALRSAKLLAEVRDRHDFDFSFRRAGKLVLLHSASDVRAAERTNRLKNQHGCAVTLLSRQEAIDLEPALADFRVPFSAAVYSAGDELGDARSFAIKLGDALESSAGVNFRFSTLVEGFVRSSGGRVIGVRGQDEIRGDAVVVCLGVDSNKILQSVGIKTSIYPVRGYSVTLPLGESAPTTSITMPQQRIVFSRMNGRLRIAGFADFRGFDSSADKARVQTLCRIAIDAAPEVADFSVANVQPWGGFRPMTPNGQPLVGPSGIDGLFLNTGHGMLGWTLAFATAETLTGEIANSRKQATLPAA